jgi:hypothetical protein
MFLYRILGVLEIHSGAKAEFADDWLALADENSVSPSKKL